MKRGAIARIAAACVVAGASCVRVTTERGAAPVGPAPTPGEKGKVRVRAWNPFDEILDVVSFPVKAAGKGLGKIF